MSGSDELGNLTPSSTSQATGQSKSTLIVSCIVISLAVVSVGLRFYTRIFTKTGLKADDWSIFSAVFFALSTAVITLVANSIVPDGLRVAENTDTSYVYTDKDMLYLSLALVISILYFTIAGTTRLGILMMYNRIFNVSKSFRAQLYVASFLVIGWWISCTVAAFTNCFPLKWSWINGFSDPRYCFNYNLFWMASGACETALDVVILLMPVSVVVRMKMKWRKKSLVLGIFALGAFTLVTGIVRVILGYKKNSRLPSYSNIEVWTTVHAGMSIVCASLPIFRPLLRRVGECEFMSRLSSMLSIQKETSKDGRRPTKRRLRRPSANTNIWRLVFKVKASSAFVTTSSTKRQESAFVEPTIYQLPTVSVEEQHDSLTAQWAKFSETSDRVH